MIPASNKRKIAAIIVSLATTRTRRTDLLGSLAVAMINNRSGSRSVEAPPEAGRLGSGAASAAHTHSATATDQPDCAVCVELKARAPSVRLGVGSMDATMSREATGRHASHVVNSSLQQGPRFPFTTFINSIPHSDHRYSTVGDWQFREAQPSCVRIDIQVSATADWRHAALIAVHELIEAILCRARGISQDEVDSFDLAHSELSDPGASENAPYHDQHMVADFIERYLATELNVSWRDYTVALESLDD